MSVDVCSSKSGVQYQNERYVHLESGIRVFSVVDPCPKDAGALVNMLEAESATHTGLQAVDSISL